jgi:glutaredoxin-like protein NrdH
MTEATCPMEKVKGKKMGHIRLYALSTCGWCKKTKELLNELGVEYEYVFVDLLEEEEKDKMMDIVGQCNPRRSFPTLVIDGRCIVGFKEAEICDAIR